MTSQTFRAIASLHLYAHIQISYKQVKLLARIFTTTSFARPIVHSLAIMRDPVHINPLKDDLIRNLRALLACLGSTTDNVAPLHRLYIQQSSFVPWANSKKEGYRGNTGSSYLLDWQEIVQLLPDLTDLGCISGLYRPWEPTYANLERLVVEDYFYSITCIEQIFQLLRSEIGVFQPWKYTRR